MAFREAEAPVRQTRAFTKKELIDIVVKAITENETTSDIPEPTNGLGGVDPVTWDFAEFATRPYASGPLHELSEDTDEVLEITWMQRL